MQPFYEAQVQQHVAAHLEGQGYWVRQEVDVRGGRADILASRDDETLLIEAKGEDMGRYTSAEMNLQMGFGQLLSRMNKPEWRYGLAMPNTPDFRRVLMKYAGGFGLVKLGCTFYVVHEDGRVDEYDCRAFQRFVNQMAAGIR